MPGTGHDTWPQKRQVAGGQGKVAEAGRWKREREKEEEEEEEQKLMISYILCMWKIGMHFICCCNILLPKGKTSRNETNDQVVWGGKAK